MNVTDDQAAGLGALAEGRWPEARTLLEGVLESAVEPSIRATAAAGISDAAWWMGDVAGALQARRMAYEAWRDAHNDEAAAGAALWLAREYLGAVGNEAAAQGWLRRAETLAGASPAASVAGWVALTRATLRPDGRSGDVGEALRLAREARDGDLEALALARLGLGKVVDGDLTEALACFNEAMAMSTGGETSLEALGNVCCDLARATEAWGSLEPFAQWIEVVSRVAGERGHPPLVAFCSTCCAEVFTAGGDWVRAEAELRNAIAKLELTGHHARCLAPVARLADLLVKQGRLEEAEQLLAEDRTAATLAVRGRLALARGNASEAAALLERARRRSGGDSIQTIGPMAILAEAYVGNGRLDEADRVVSRMQVVAVESGNRIVTGRAALASARVLTARGDSSAALAAAETALDHFTAVAPGAIEVAETHLLLARLQGGAAPDLALAEARASVTAFEAAGATARCHEAAALARSLGDHSRVGAKGLGELTDREQEVLRLLALGLTNAELAKRLFISPKTAENHVSRILTKLNLRSRTEAAAYAHTHPDARS